MPFMQEVEAQMSFLSHALELASQGFHVFPLVPNSKTPLIEDFPHRATRDPEIIEKWWFEPILEIEQPYNVGISTTRFGDDEALLVVDIDNKEGKNGDAELEKLRLEGQTLPETFGQTTPTGGRHLAYRVPSPVKQGTNVLAEGLDVRSQGGYIVGSGSVLEGRQYLADFRQVVAAPEWLVARCGEVRVRVSDSTGKGLEKLNSESARSRAIHYLEKLAPLSVEGHGGDQTAFAVAAKVKDFGVDELTCYDLLLEHWNPKCDPSWNADELAVKVRNAYAYGANSVGVDSPETQFDVIPTDEVQKPALHPFEVLNLDYAFVVIGGNGMILHETTDADGNFELGRLNVPTFHQLLASDTIMYNGKTTPLTKAWIRDPRRRTYDGICFLPGKKASERYYNLWRGFAVTPPTPRQDFSDKARASIAAFFEHTFENICDDHVENHQWLISFFAHIFQKPWEKPLVALVFQGGKGVGKSSVVEFIGRMLTPYYMVVNNKDQLLKNFNSHMEGKLLINAEEAFWSGDKTAEGKLKDLISRPKILIERKFQEPYEVANYARLVIIGNEKWVVPASEDERRYAVFKVGDGRKQDLRFFTAMREGLEDGGYSLLLDYFLKFDLSKVQLNQAPVTAGLLEQKLNTLDSNPFKRFWKECLLAGRIVGSDFSEGWSEEVSKTQLRTAFLRYLAEQRIGAYTPTESSIGADLSVMSPSSKSLRKRVGSAGRAYFYQLATLKKSRTEFENYLGQKLDWDDEEGDIFT